MTSGIIENFPSNPRRSDRGTVSRAGETEAALEVVLPTGSLGGTLGTSAAIFSTSRSELLASGVGSFSAAILIAGESWEHGLARLHGPGTTFKKCV